MGSAVVPPTVAGSGVPASLLAVLAADRWDVYRRAVPAAADAALPTLSAAETAAVTDALAASMSPATARAYRSDWDMFERWCLVTGRVSLPAHGLLVAAYVADRAALADGAGRFLYRPATMRRWVAAINRVHRAAGMVAPGEHPAVAATLSGVRRLRGARQQGRAPILLDDLRALVGSIRGGDRAAGQLWPSRVASARDVALLLVGWIGAFRRSELVGLRFADVSLDRADGLHLRLGRTKTDRDGRGMVKIAPRAADHDMCPPCALHHWMRLVAASDRGGRAAVLRDLQENPAARSHVCHQPLPTPAGTADAPLFRTVHRLGHIGAAALSGAAVDAMIRRRSARAGFDPAIVDLWGGHSLRVGFVTQAIRDGATPSAVMQQTGHKTVAMVHHYVREYNPGMGNAATAIRL